MGIGSWLARSLREVAQAERQSTEDAIGMARGIRDDFRAAVECYRQDKRNEEQGRQIGAGPLRAPLALRQSAHQCLSCVAANILHMFGLAGGDARAVDRYVGRRRGETAQPARIARLLLESGLGVHSINPYDHERFLTHGLDYLQWFYAREWNTAWDEHWTAQELARHHQECAEELALDRFAGYSTEHRHPELSDVRDWLDRGRVVYLAIDNGKGDVSCHAVLVYAHYRNRRGGSFEVYDPRESLVNFSTRELSRLWLRDEGMGAVGRLG